MNKKHIQQLIDRYDDGMTSNAEERELRDIFRKLPATDMPQEWATYRAMFAFIDSEVQPSHTAPEAIPRKTLLRRLFTTRLTACAAACAAIAIVAILTANTARGDYAVINGKVVTDKSVVMTEACAALQTVAYSDEAFGALDEFENTETE